MIIEYKEMDKDALLPHDRWIIAFCPDTDSFFATNQRCFFWETKEDFPSENEAIRYFENNLSYFLEEKNRMMREFFVYGYAHDDYVYLENTGKVYYNSKKS